MRITFLSPPPNLSGGERVVAAYARELTRLGHDVTVICSRERNVRWWDKIKSLAKGRGWPKAPPKNDDSHYRNYGIRHKITSSDSGINLFDVPDSDAVVATLWSTAHWVHQLPPGKGKKFYLVQHDEGHLLPRFPAEETYGFPMCHIYVSQWIASRIRARFPEAAGIIINNAIDIDDFDRGERAKPSRLRVGMMWGGVRSKGGDISIEAVRQVRARGLDVELVSFGSQSPPEQYASEMNEFFLQPQKERMAEIYGSCSAWLFTSRFEGFGLPILEAMAARTPVIGTPTGAAPELITQGGGILVPMDDPRGTADAIETIAKLDPGAWKKMSDAAYLTAHSLSWHDAANAFEQYLLSSIHF